MRGISISKSLGYLGLDPSSRIYDAVRGSISSFMKKTVDVHTASDEELEDAANKYLHDANGASSWADSPVLKYRWSVEDDRQVIQTAVFRVMQSKQENAIKTLHGRGGECPGCRIHSPPPPSLSETASPEPQVPAQSDIPQVTSDIEIVPPERPRPSRPTFQDPIPIFDDLRDLDYSNQGRSRKRKRRNTVSVTQDRGQAGPSRPQVLNPNAQDTASVRSNLRATIDSPMHDNAQAGPSRPRAPTTMDLQDATSIRSGSRAAIDTPTIRPIQSSNWPHSSTIRASPPSGSAIMNLRGKRWIFDSVEEQARILTDVVAHQLEVMESLLAEMDGEKSQLGRRALQCERSLEDYLLEKKVEWSR